MLVCLAQRLRTKPALQLGKHFPLGLVGVLWQPGELEVLFTMAGNALLGLLGCIFPIAGAWVTLETLLLSTTHFCGRSPPQVSVDLGHGKGEDAFRQSVPWMVPKCFFSGRPKRVQSRSPTLQRGKEPALSQDPQPSRPAIFACLLSPSVLAGAAGHTCPDAGASVRPVGIQLGGLRTAVSARQVP